MRESDKYTQATRRWLNARFDVKDNQGYYVPNQPSYGFSALAFRLEEYARTCAILRTIDSLNFKNALDVGSADGYLPALIQDLFKRPVTGCDLSDRAIYRARQMYSVQGFAVDAHCMPLPDESYDLVIASEVLEHVEDPGTVIMEMCRIAKKFVLLTTPRARNQSDVDRHFKNLDPGEPHAHIHFFTYDALRALIPFNARFRGARFRYISRLYDMLAWDDESTLDQRKAYLEFTLKSTEISGEARDWITHMLIGRYRTDGGLKKRFVRADLVGLLLELDIKMAGLFPLKTHDHLVLITKSGDFKSRNYCDREIIRKILKEFHVKKLRVESL